MGKSWPSLALGGFGARALLAARQHPACSFPGARSTANSRDALAAALWGWPRCPGQITLILHWFLPLWTHVQNTLPVTQRPGGAWAEPDQQPQLRSTGQGSTGAAVMLGGISVQQSLSPAWGALLGGAALAWGHRSAATGTRRHPLCLAGPGQGELDERYLNNLFCKICNSFQINYSDNIF